MLGNEYNMQLRIEHEYIFLLSVCVCQLIDFLKHKKSKVFFKTNTRTQARMIRTKNLIGTKITSHLSMFYCIY